MAEKAVFCAKILINIRKLRNFIMKRPQKLCRNKFNNTAYITVNGKQVYLGKWGSEEAQTTYERFLLNRIKAKKEDQPNIPQTPAAGLPSPNWSDSARSTASRNTPRGRSTTGRPRTSGLIVLPRLSHHRETDRHSRGQLETGNETVSPADGRSEETVFRIS